MHDALPATPAPEADDVAEGLPSVTYPIESPLSAWFDPFTGVLTIEAAYEPMGGQGAVCLRLNFSPDATLGFARVLKSVEKAVGVAIDGQPHLSLRH